MMRAILILAGWAALGMIANDSNSEFIGNAMFIWFWIATFLPLAMLGGRRQGDK